MLRRIFPALLLFSVLGAQAQNCVPDQNVTQSGFYPKQAEVAYVDSNYKQVLQIRVFKDTTVIIGGNPVTATIDSINVLDIKGLPSGFYYTCYTTSCSFVPDSTGCATLEGKASAGQIGVYPLDIELEVFAKIFGTVNTSQKDTIRQFELVVDDMSGVGYITSKSRLVYPNPTHSGSLWFSSILENSVTEISCFNQTGQKVDYKLIKGKMSLSSNPNGLYTVVLTLDNGEVLTQKILLQQ